MSLSTYAAKLHQRRAELSTMIDMHETFNGYGGDDDAAERIRDLREKLADIEFDLKQQGRDYWYDTAFDYQDHPHYLGGR